MTWTMTDPTQYEDDLDAKLRAERVVVTPALRARLAELTAAERDVYAEQLGLRVENAAESIDPRGEIVPHEYFSESARGADTFLGPQGRFQESLGSAGRGAGKGAMVAAALFGGVGLANFTAPPAYAAAPVDIDGVINGAASNGGVGGTYWSTDVCVVQDVADNVVMKMYPGSTGSPADVDRFIQFDVPKGEQVCVQDVLAGFGQEVQPSALFYDWQGIDADQGAVAARTWTVLPDGGAGSMGQGTPGLDLEDIPAGRPHVVPVAQDPNLVHRDDAHFRTNVGVANANRVPTMVNVELHDVGGGVVAEKDYALPALSWFQINDIFHALGFQEDPDGVGFREQHYVTVTPTESANHLIGVYSSIIDNKSGDPVFNAAQSRHNTPSPSFIPAAAHLGGVNGTFWVTDLDVTNVNGSNGDPYSSTFMQEGRDNFPGGVGTQTELMSSGGLFQIADVIQNWFGLEDVKGALGTGANMQQWSRTYTTLEGKTFGAGMPALRIADHAVAADNYSLIPGLSQSSDGDNGFRSNIGIVNTGIEPRTVTVELYDDDLVRTINTTLQPWDMTQLNKAYGNTDITNGWAKVTSDATGIGDDTGVLAYGSVVDNQSGDGTTVLAKRVSPTSASAAEVYVAKWLGETNGFPLDTVWYNNNETNCMWKEECGIVGYRQQLSQLLVGTDGVPAGWSASDIENFILNFFDGNPSNGEIDETWDNSVYQNSPGTSQNGLAFAMASGGITPFNVSDTERMNQIHTEVWRPYLVDLVGLHPEMYGGTLGGEPDIDFDPGWGTQDPTP